MKEVDKGLYVRQLHFNTENAYARELTGDAVSIPLSIWLFMYHIIIRLKFICHQVRSFKTLLLANVKQG